MTYLDYFILGVLAIFLVKGYFKGLINQVMSIAGMITGLILAWQLYPAVSEYGTGIGIPQTVSMIVSFILIYAAVVFIAKFLGKILHKIAKILLLGWVNRLAGAVFGLVEGLLLMVILSVLISFVPLNSQMTEFGKKSPVFNLLQQLAAPFSEKIEPPQIDFLDAL